jgi:hypothetical protein
MTVNKQADILLQGIAAALKPMLAEMDGRIAALEVENKALRLSVRATIRPSARISGEGGLLPASPQP